MAAGSQAAMACAGSRRLPPYMPKKIRPLPLLAQQYVKVLMAGNQAIFFVNSMQLAILEAYEPSETSWRN